MKRTHKYLLSILFSSAVLLGLSTTPVSANANHNQVNSNQQDQPQASLNIQSKQDNINQSGPENNVNHFYNRRQKGTGRIYQVHYQFTKQPGRKSRRSSRGYYKQSVRYNRVAENQYGTFIKTRHGWLNRNALNQFIITHGHLHYQMRVVHNGNLYNLPAHTNNAHKVATTREFHLYHHWVGVNAVATTNLTDGYYRFGYQGKNYWIPGQDLMFNLKALRGHNRRLERIIAYGERMIGHSKYNEKTQHYDCASFMHHIFAKGGVHIAYDGTYSQVQDGRPVSLKHLKRGDLVFFNTYYSFDAYNHKISGNMAHVAMYIGHGLILQDTPDDDNGGVDVSSLHDPQWNSYSHYPTVHRLNGLARRII